MLFDFTYLLVAIALLIAVWYTIKLSLLVLLFSLAGYYAGLKTQYRVDQAIFNRGLLVLLALVGLLLIVRAGTQGS